MIFKKGQVVIYKTPYKFKGSLVPDEQALFDRIDSEGKAIILIKLGTEFTKRRKVNLEYLRRADV